MRPSLSSPARHWHLWVCWRGGCFYIDQEGCTGGAGEGGPSLSARGTRIPWPNAEAFYPSRPSLGGGRDRKRGPQCLWPWWALYCRVEDTLHLHVSFTPWRALTLLSVLLASWARCGQRRAFSPPTCYSLGGGKPAASEHSDAAQLQMRQVPLVLLRPLPLVYYTHTAAAVAAVVARAGGAYFFFFLRTWDSSHSSRTAHGALPMGAPSGHGMSGGTCV